MDDFFYYDFPIDRGKELVERLVEHIGNLALFLRPKTITGCKAIQLGRIVSRPIIDFQVYGEIVIPTHNHATRFINGRGIDFGWKLVNGNIYINSLYLHLQEDLEIFIGSSEIRNYFNTLPFDSPPFDKRQKI